MCDVVEGDWTEYDERMLREYWEMSSPTEDMTELVLVMSDRSIDAEGWGVAHYNLMRGDMLLGVLQQTPMDVVFFPVASVWQMGIADRRG